MNLETNLLEGLIWNGDIKLKRKNKREPALLFSDFTTVKAFWSGRLYHVGETTNDIVRLAFFSNDAYVLFEEAQELVPVRDNFSGKSIYGIDDIVNLDKTPYAAGHNAYWVFGTENTKNTEFLILRLGTYFDIQARREKICYSTADGNIRDALTSKLVSKPAGSDAMVGSMICHGQFSYKVQDNMVYDFYNNQVFTGDCVTEIAIYKGRPIAGCTSGKIYDIETKKELFTAPISISNMISVPDRYMLSIQDQIEEVV